ncbi:MAG TPA: hypothetical protein VHG72_04385 [Polyangia bacterium]|nr:hypothetical protein [Polyangia bacterium]
MAALALALVAGCGGGGSQRRPASAERPAGPPAPGAPAQLPLDDEAPEPISPVANAPQVTIKLLAEAGRQAHVFWGRKDLGVAPLELHRPRGSGPLDLLVVAPGYLPLHTRVFTDHDDVLSLRLYDENGAGGLLGHPVGHADPGKGAPAGHGEIRRRKPRTARFSLPTSTGFTQNAGTFPRPRR